jgi:hypothetical protein
MVGIKAGILADLSAEDFQPLGNLLARESPVADVVQGDLEPL